MSQPRYIRIGRHDRGEPMAAAQQEGLFLSAMATGSAKLLAAIWHAHPGIMFDAAARGRNVVKPRVL